MPNDRLEGANPKLIVVGDRDSPRSGLRAQLHYDVALAPHFLKPVLFEDSTHILA